MNAKQLQKIAEILTSIATESPVGTVDLSGFTYRDAVGHPKSEAQFGITFEGVEYMYVLDAAGEVARQSSMVVDELARDRAASVKSQVPA
jgi:hypothetical protein